MAEAACLAQAQQQPAGVATTTTTGSDVSARLQQVLSLLFPSNLVAKAALFALVVALLPLLPTSQGPRIWELPHLLLLGIIISYGVFGQKNADAEVVAAAATADDARPVVGDDEASVEAYVSQMMQGSPLVFDDNDRDDGDGASKVGVQAWSSRYVPDNPLVVVADANNGDGDAGEKPLLLPVRKLKPAVDDSPTLPDDVSDGGTEKDEEEEEEDEGLLAPKVGYDGVRERAIPSPSSVLDADLTLSPSSPPLLPPPPPPPPPPFLGRGSRSFRKAKARSFSGAIGDRSTNGRLGLHGVDGKQFRSKSAVQATRSAFAGYDPVVPLDDDDDDDAVDAELDEAVAASESSFGSDMVTDDGEEENVFDEDEEAVEEAEEEDASSCDEELFELATKPGPELDEEEVEDEVDRKADEFIAKFREQIRMQRVQPAARR